MSDPPETVLCTRAEAGADRADESGTTSTMRRMPMASPTGSTGDRSRSLAQRCGPPDDGRASPHAPKLTITENALRYIAERRERLGRPVKGIRVRATPRSPLRADLAVSFVPAEEPDAPTALVQSVGGLDVHVAPEDAPYVEGATIDFVFKLVGSELKVLAPLRPLDTPDGRMAAKIQQVLAEQVNPSLALHGGAAELVDVKDGIAFVELTGGCQGCGMADATMKAGIERSIRDGVPGVQEVRDVTEHARGRHPYFQP